MAISRVQHGHFGAIFWAISPLLERDFGAIFDHFRHFPTLSQGNGCSSPFLWAIIEQKWPFLPNPRKTWIFRVFDDFPYSIPRENDRFPDFGQLPRDFGHFLVFPALECLIPGLVPRICLPFPWDRVDRLPPGSPAGGHFPGFRGFSAISRSLSCPYSIIRYFPAISSISRIFLSQEALNGLLYKCHSATRDQSIKRLLIGFPTLWFRSICRARKRRFSTHFFRIFHSFFECNF